MESKSNGVNDGNTRLNINGDTSIKNENHEEPNEVDDHSAEIVELNHRMKNDFMSYCLSFLQDDEEARECIQIVWNKYLQCVGDVSTISAFFDILPYTVKISVLEKYQNEIIDWCRHVLHLDAHAILYATHYNETFARIIRCALKQSIEEKKYSLKKKAIIYVSIDFDVHLKTELLSSMTNIHFQHISNDVIREDLIEVNRLEEIIKRDLNDQEVYPCMVIANAGTSLLGRCDELSQIKQLCQEHNLWLHVIGDLVGSLSLLSTIKDNVNINCDSLTIDSVKLFGIQNLPYLTIFLRSLSKIPQERHSDIESTQNERPNIDNLSATGSNVSSSSSATTTPRNSTNISDPPSLYDVILHNPSIGFLSIWSITQRCSKSNVLYHMKCSFDLSNTLTKRLIQMKSMRILNDDYNNQPQSGLTYKRICSGEASDDPLPKTVVLFRYETLNIPEIEKLDDLDGYIDLLNLWLFDKLSQQYPKMNFELLKSVHFQLVRPDHENNPNRPAAHAIRFAPLEHLLDVIDEQDILTFCDDMQRYNEILFATMTARARLSSAVQLYGNLVSIPVPHWAGIGAIRFIPNDVDSDESKAISADEINTIQAELARKLQSNDSAFSLGGGITEQESMFYLRLGMIRKQNDLDILLEKIAEKGKETETSLKYVEDMAEKIKAGIEQAQKDLQHENRQILAQEGLLRQLPVISNIMSWWSPSPSSSPLATKGRSFDLNSGRIESTESTYVYRMQIEKQSPHAPTHDENPRDSSPIDADVERNSNDNIPEEKDNL